MLLAGGGANNGSAEALKCRSGGALVEIGRGCARATVFGSVDGQDLALSSGWARERRSAEAWRQLSARVEQRKWREAGAGEWQQQRPEQYMFWFAGQSEVRRRAHAERRQIRSALHLPGKPQRSHGQLQTTQRLPVCLSLLATGTFVDCAVPNGGDPLFGDDADGRQCQCRAMAVSRVWYSLEPSAGLQMSTFIAGDGARAHLSGGEIAGSRGGGATGMDFPRCDGAMDKRESVGAGEAGDGVGSGDEREDGGSGGGAGAIARAGEEKKATGSRDGVRCLLGGFGGCWAVVVVLMCCRVQSEPGDGWVSLPRLGGKQARRVVPAASPVPTPGRRIRAG